MIIENTSTFKMSSIPKVKLVCEVVEVVFQVKQTATSDVTCVEILKSSFCRFSIVSLIMQHFSIMALMKLME